MSKHYDATAKELLEADPPGWVEFLHLPAGGPVTVTDSDVSTVTAAADKVLLIGGRSPHLIHIEFQARRDTTLPRRLLWYNVLIDHKHEKPVQSVAILLKRKADVRSIDGRLTLRQADGQEYLAFRYRVVRIWEQPVESLLEGPLATLPLAPISDVERRRLPEVLRRMDERLDAEADPTEATRLLVAARVFTGMRLKSDDLDHLFREVFMSRIYGLEESSFARDLIDKGRIEGRAEGRAEGLANARRMLLTLGRALIGPPGPEVIEAVGRIDGLDRIEALSDRLPSVGSWEELLDGPGPTAEAQR